MPLPLIITVVAFLLWEATGALVWLIVTTPEGYELPGIGFRYGRQPENDAGAQNTDALSFAPVSLSLHSSASNPEGQRHHGH